MAHPRVNEFYLRMNERRGMNEISVPNVVEDLESCIYFFLPTQNGIRE